LSLQVARVGCFPDLRHPRVLWVGVQDQAGELIPLQKAIGNAVRDFTIEQPEKQFSGHVTLGRTKILSRSESELWCNLVSGMAQRNFGQWTAGGLEIIRSELLPAGPRHTCLATVAFTG
jgi:2'-5' RNA ligase